MVNIHRIPDSDVNESGKWEPVRHQELDPFIAEMEELELTPSNLTISGVVHPTVQQYYRLIATIRYYRERTHKR